MTRNLKFIVGAMAGLAIPALGEGSAAAQSKAPSVFMVQDADPQDLARTRDGRLRKTDEEFTNEQAVVKLFPDGKSGLYFDMRTSRLSTGEAPVHNMQLGCTPIAMVQDPATGAVNFQRAPGERFVTDNDGNEYRNANKPEVFALDADHMLVTYNYQPEGTNDTRRYAKVVNKSCQEMPLVNGNNEPRKQITIMAKNNDDCDMSQTGDGNGQLRMNSDGSYQLIYWAGCNGNGRDDGWLNSVRIANQGGSWKITRTFDISLARREERSRGRCTMSDEDQNTAICTWTEGNNQPQRDGTWIAAVDVSEGGENGENAESRLLWKEQFDGRKEGPDGERTYSSRAMHTRLLVKKADGSLGHSNMIVMRAGDLEGRNTNNRKGGQYKAQQMAVIKVTREGLEYITPKFNAQDLLLGIDGTHLSMSAVLLGEGDNLTPGFAFLQGSHNGGGVSVSQIKLVSYDPVAKTFADAGTATTGAYYDRHLYANYLGNNPGNQGRNFAGCQMVKNPFVGQNGNRTQYFTMCALTGKSEANLMNAALKPSSYVTLTPVATVPAPAPPPATPPPSTTPPGGGTGDGSGNGDGNNSGTGGGSTPDPMDDPADAAAPSMMGCSVGSNGSDSGFALVLVGLGLAFIVRRRRA